MIAQFVKREDKSLDSGDMRGHGKECEYTEENHPFRLQECILSRDNPLYQHT
jgi:hypothetical protein